MHLTGILYQRIRIFTETLFTVIRPLSTAQRSTEASIRVSDVLLMIAAGQEWQIRFATWRSELDKEGNSICGIIGIIGKQRVLLGCLKGYSASNIAAMIRLVSRPWSTDQSNAGGRKARPATTPGGSCAR